MTDFLIAIVKAMEFAFMYNQIGTTCTKYGYDRRSNL